jgi:hypothetical protein
LSTNPQLAKKIVLSPRPLISEQSFTLETEFLEKLIENIGHLSCVYSKKPEDFVKRLKDNANAKEVVEEDAEELLAKNQHEEKAEFFEDKKISFANQQEQLVDNTPSELINVQKSAPPVEVKPAPVNNLIDV